MSHAKTQSGLRLKIERLKIAEQQNAELRKELESASASKSKKPQHKTRPSYEQPTCVLTEDEIEKKGKGAILKEMRKNNLVAFPDRSDSELSNH